MAVLAVWQMAGGGLDDDPAAGAQFAPSGEYGVSKKSEFAEWRTCRRLMGRTMPPASGFTA